MTAASLGKMLTTAVRRFISPLKSSIGFVTGMQTAMPVSSGRHGLVVLAYGLTIRDGGDRDAAPPLMRMSHGNWLFLQLAFMNSGYAGDRAARTIAIHIEIVHKPIDQGGFAVHACRWVVERSFA
jgi:hypothetical protein